MMGRAMKTYANFALAGCIAAGAVISLPVHAVTVNKEATGTDLTAGASWVGGIAPGSGDVAKWGNGDALGGTLTMGSSLSWQGMNVYGASGVITTTGVGTLTLGGAGISLLGGVNLTVNNHVAVGASQDWVVGSGRTLLINTTGSTIAFNSGTTTTLSGAGTVEFGNNRVLTGAGDLVVDGVILSNNLQGGTQTRTGDTYLNSGTIKISTGVSLFGSGDLHINGGNIGSGNTNRRTIGNTVYVGDDFEVGGAGVSSGAIQFSGAMDFGSASRTIMATSIFEINGTVSNAPALVKTGAGSLVLGAVNMSGTSLTLSAGGMLLGGNGTATIGSLSGVAGTTIASNYNLVSNGLRPLSVNQTVDGEFHGTITNAGGGARSISLTKTGAATLTLTGVNTYDGSTTVSAGTLKISGAGQLGGGTYAGAITDNATLHIGTTAAQTLSGSISGSGTLVKSNSGTLTISNTGNTFSGTTSVNGGTLNLTGATGSTSKLAVGGGTFSYQRATAQTVNGLTVNAGSSTVANTNSGATNVLNLGAITRSAGGAVNFPTATAANNVVTTSTANTNGILGPWATVGQNWAANDGSGSIVAFTAYTDVTRLSSGTKAIANDATANVRVVDGTGGTGNITLAAADTTSNSLLQSATGGAVTVDTTAATFRTGGILMASGASALTIGTAANAGTLTAASAGGDLLVRNNVASSSNTLTIHSTIANNTSASSVSIIGNSASNPTVTLTGTNTYSGGTTLGGDGWISVGHNSALGTGDVIFNNSGIFRFSSDSGTGRSLSNPVTFNGEGVARMGAGSPSNGTLTFSGAVSLGGASRTLDTAVNTYFTGTVSNGGITKQGAANLYLQGANIFSGLLDITTSGTVALEHVGAVNGAPSVNMSAGNLGIGAPFVGNTATIGNLTGTGGTITTQWNAGNGVRTLQVNQTVDGTFAGVLQSEGAGLRQLALIKTGTATLTLSGNSTYSGGTTISQGTLIATHANAFGTSGTVTLNNPGTGANNTNLLLGNVTLGRAITVANQGSGTVTLGANGSVALPTFSGAITLNKGVTLDGSTNTDRLTFSGGIGGTGDVTIAGSSRVVFTTTANTYNGTTTINSNSILQLSDGSATSTQLLPNASVLTLNAGAFLKLAKGANSETIGGLSGTGTVRGHEGVPSVASALVINNSGSHNFGGVLENGGALGATLSLTKSGAGAQTLSGNNTYSGATTVSDGMLIAQGGYAIGDNSTVDLANLPTAQLQITHTEQVGALNGGGASGGNIALSSGITLTTGNNNASTSYGGVISGVGASLNKRGTGTQTLTGASSFSGAVTIDNGVLGVDAIAASGNQPLGTGTGSIAMLNGSTLRFTGTSGTTGRGLTLSGTNGGQVEVSNAAGTLTLGGTISGASANFTKNGAGTFNQTGSGDWTGNTFITGGTYNVTSTGSIGNTGEIQLTGSATLNINTTTQVRAASLDITSGTVNLNSGALRTNGITMASGTAFSWGAGTLTMQTAATGSTGSTDRREPGSSGSTLPVYEGTRITIDGAAAGLATTTGSVLDLGPTYTSGGMRYDQLQVSGSLNLTAAGDTLNFDFNPRFFRPSVFGADGAGTLILVDGTSFSGTFDSFTGVLSDYIGFTAAPNSGSVVGVLGVSTLNPLTDIPVDTYYLEYETDTGNVLFHYRLSASVPEPASAGLLVVGALFLRALRRHPA